ncbi:DeoR/GlpR family DNA-binding transcription regulator [Pseudalkalibacillus decolorationis]|uniref:DeoR/GlpR family DNA-binding transcription regulator n=1 Tax=Pseudalkalibacillus decolorationis TaxID=163879 RepID=UPI0021475FCB|nr:DeoR/GlpR family DNA-binding transcription regulator [Pseudalkalibacillus decolorationis]
MLSVERQEKILQYVKEDKTVKVSDLSELFCVTEKTIRKDLIFLEGKGYLKRIHGGAVLPQHGGIYPIAERQSKHITEKQSIAQKALTSIEIEDTVFLDGGSTILELAKILGEFPVTVITNDINIANALSKKELVHLVVLGGTRIADTSSLYGALVSEALDQIRVNRLFLGSTGIEPNYGLTVFHHLHAQFKRSIIKTASKVTLLVDHTKFGQSALVKFANLSEIDEIIVDKGLNEHFQKEIKRHNVNIILV